MDAELKAKWVAALRSGDYEQAFETLRDDRGYCCLAVLLDVSGAGVWDNLGVYNLPPDDEGGSRYCEGDLGDYRDASGISGVHHCTLVHLNDDERRTFPEIADWIEANIPAS